MVLVDTNVLVDVLQNDPQWAEWSIAQLRAQAKLQALAINPVICAEISLSFSTLEALDDVVLTMALDLRKIPRPALFLAAKAFARYRRLRSGGRASAWVGNLGQNPRGSTVRVATARMARRKPGAPPSPPESRRDPVSRAQTTQFAVDHWCTARIDCPGIETETTSGFSRLQKENAMASRFVGLMMALGVASATIAATDADNGFTIHQFDADAYAHPAPVLSYRERETFLHGRSHFKRRWIAPITFNGEWGLGPTFIQTRCSECHINNGRGGPPASANEQISTMLVRLSLPGTDEHGGPKPDPNYGDQFQNNALQAQEVDLRYSFEKVPAEAELYLDWEEHVVTLPDGEKVPMRKPRLRIENLAFGPLGEGAMMSIRNTQSVFGLGLLEAVSEDTLKALAAEQQKQGLNGRINYVWDFINERTAVGRFGWKAGQATLMGQTAAAFLGDLGVTSRYQRVNNCPPVQKACLIQPITNDPEILDSDMVDFELWLRGLAVPARRNLDDPQVQQGGKLFAEVGCANCHTPVMTTAAAYPAFPKLANRVFFPYTDLLLHDMGEELADHRPEFKAGGRDWRTAPLWGIGLNKTVNGQTALLHDARARTVLEAILWHGGEGTAPRSAFTRLKKEDRDALVRYVESI